MSVRTEILKYGRIRNLRIDRGLTQEQIAGLLQVSQTMYSQYEIGVSRYLLDPVVGLAEDYDVSVNDLVGLTDRQSPYPRRRHQP